MTAEHPFARYVRILGRGPGGSRSLTEEESRDAMRMVLDSAVEPAQLGAFLMLIRYKRETADELAGFVRAVRESLDLPDELPAVDLDWPSYAAGKSRGLPWFLLSALLIAENGVRVFMHGYNSHHPHPVNTAKGLASLGVPISGSLHEAAALLETVNFAYTPLGAFCPRLQELLELRPLLGLRSPANSLARLLNPFRAPGLLGGVFHPGYRELHRDAAALLGQPGMSVFKGGGGEAERNPYRPCLAYVVRDGVCGEEEWPAKLPKGKAKDDGPMDGGRLVALWRGELDDDESAAVVIGTAAIALGLVGRTRTVEEAEALANRMWETRPRRRFG